LTPFFLALKYSVDPTSVSINENPRQIKCIWTLDQNNKGKDISLSKNNLEAMKQNNTNHYNSSIMGSTVFERGKVVWKVKIDALKNDQWVAFGVYEIKYPFEHASGGFDSVGVHSWSSSNQSYGSSGEFKFSGNAEIWMKVDFDRGTLFAYSPTTNQKGSAKISSPIKPFFNIHCEGNTVTVEPKNLGEVPLNVSANLE